MHNVSTKIDYANVIAQHDPLRKNSPFSTITYVSILAKVILANVTGLCYVEGRR